VTEIASGEELNSGSCSQTPGKRVYQALRPIRSREQNEKHCQVEDRPTNDDDFRQFWQSLSGHQPQRNGNKTEAEHIDKEGDHPQEAVMLIGERSGRQFRNDCPSAEYHQLKQPRSVTPHKGKGSGAPRNHYAGGKERFVDNSHIF
jgi:hypothetical protein